MHYTLKAIKCGHLFKATKTRIISRRLLSIRCRQPRESKTGFPVYPSSNFFRLFVSFEKRKRKKKLFVLHPIDKLYVSLSLSKTNVNLIAFVQSVTPNDLSAGQVLFTVTIIATAAGCWMLAVWQVHTIRLVLYTRVSFAIGSFKSFVHAHIVLQLLPPNQG